ncbi:MAG: pilus assembly protein [Amphritea sp.]|nr:pilus assembly protein [Amphritea sp.]
MKLYSGFRRQHRGIATIEVVIVLPVLLLLFFGIFELTRAFQVQNIATAVTREGANLASRAFATDEQAIMDVLAQSANPLDFDQRGALYISVVVGEQSQDPFVQAQHRWSQNGLPQNSSLWGSCPSWQNDECNIPSTLPRLSNFPIALDPGETVHVVEVFYQHNVLGSYVFDNDIVLYSRSIM